MKHKLLIDDLEQYSRRHSLRLNGVPVTQNEKPKDIVNAVKYEIERLDLPIKDFEIDRAHRLGPIYMDKRGNKQQTVLCKFISWGARNVMYNARKSLNFFIKADPTRRRHKLFTYARNHMFDEESRASKLFSNMYIDSNCNIMAA